MWKVSRCKTAHGRVRSSLFHVCCLYYFPGLAAAIPGGISPSSTPWSAKSVLQRGYSWYLWPSVCKMWTKGVSLIFELLWSGAWEFMNTAKCNANIQRPRPTFRIMSFGTVSPSSQSILFVIMKCSWSLSRKSAQASRSEVLLLACREALSGESHVSRVSKGSPYSLRISVLSQQWHGPSVSKCSILKLDNHHSISKFCAVHPVLLHRLNFQQLKQQLSAMDFSLLACPELSKEPWEKLSLRIFRQNLGSRSISTCHFANKY